MSRSLSNQFATGPLLCYECDKTVYPTEKVGPVNGAVFHKNCFRCHTCGTSLNLNNYFANPVDSNDKCVYCSNHRPQLKKTEIDTQAVSLRTALSAQNFYNKAKDKDSDIHRKTNVDANAISIKQAVRFTQMRSEESDTKARALSNVPSVQLESVGIQGPVRAQKLRKQKKATFGRHHYFPQLVEQRRKEIRQAQENLEKQHRAEEDKLLNKLQAEKEAKEKKMAAEVKQTWDSRLSELMQRRMPQKEKEEAMKTIKFKEQEHRQTIETQIQEEVQERTAELVARQSKEMLKLLATKHQEIETEITSLEQKDQSSQTAEAKTKKELQVTETASESSSKADSKNETDDSDLPGAADAQTVLSFIPDRIPSPCPPSRPKQSLYTDPDVFKQLDDHVVSIAEAEQLTFTELADELTAMCMSDLEKVRTIFRWITLKDLSQMTIGRSNPDTPVGLLRGIRYGTETYHVLFMRLCSYAGLHAVEIKGYSKSVGYEPGMQFRNAHRFKNVWNAVLVDGDWRLVQCNWAARQFVHKKSTGSRSAQPQLNQMDSLHYRYDEHYFLTDPEKFIYEFYPFEPKWQLLDSPISLPEFEDLPQLRSSFFQFGMQLPPGTRSVLEANELGGTKLEISLRDPALPVVCHFQMRCAETGSAYYQGSKLERLVFLTVPTPGCYLFDIHVPNKLPYYLEIFAAQVNPEDEPGQQLRLKIVAKFKVVSPNMQKRMSPLPQSSSCTGEWGPSKALNMFKIKPLTHASAMVSFDAAQAPNKELCIEFWVPDSIVGNSYSFSVLLHKNGLTPQVLSRFVRVQMDKNTLIVRLRPPESGQYALELFLEKDSNQKTHVCKYLIKCVNIPDSLVSLSKLNIDESKAKSGPNSAALKKLPVSCLSNAKFKDKIEANSISLQFGIKGDIDLIAAVSRFPDGRPGVEDHSDNCEVHVVDSVATIVAQFVTEGKYNVHILAKRFDETDFELCFTYKLEVKLPSVAKA